MKEPCVYIMASKMRGTLYVGVTSNLRKRVEEHRTEWFKGFSSKYAVKDLVWFEQHSTMLSAIERENQLKNMSRREKLKLVESLNPNWLDIAGQF